MIGNIMRLPKNALDCGHCQYSSQHIEPGTRTQMPCFMVVKELKIAMGDLSIEKGDDPRSDDEIAASMALRPDGLLRSVGENACQKVKTKVIAQMNDPMAPYK